jgi:putative membrane protein
MIGAAILVATYPKFRFTSLTYSMIWVLSVILMIGGHYTYANVPVGNAVRDVLGMQRNNFDRFGHFFQGVVPAMVGRELLLRTSGLRRGGWLFFLCVCAALAISASYEIFEWRYAVTFGGQNADDFLGSQGDIWDAQEDMSMALIGAILSLAALGPWQDRQLRAMGR